MSKYIFRSNKLKNIESLLKFSIYNTNETFV